MASTWAPKRRDALTKQGHRCYYCGFPIWDPAIRPLEAFLRDFAVTPRQAARLRATAEHLVPRSEGGSNRADNIAAACLHCNRTRHRRKIAKQFDLFRAFVRRRVARGRWHFEAAHRALNP